ncbi:probable cytochrome P450 313a4 [Anopheles darlingi]|uniref:probable cytochrome P450 313a4 n=1 Tax=Anopheles darlingi TaxID=43151 RepID=UPI002100117D|nr:probable cytochrome P450 313a4 [Anopheles darlingi]
MISTVVQCVLFLFAIYCSYVWRNRCSWQLLSQFPGPRNLPLIGSAYVFITDGFKSSMKRNGHVEGIEQDLSGYIYAGHDTSALTLSNTLLLLAMHPDVQERAVTEIREYYGAFDEDIQYEALQQLAYLEMVLKESLRLFPVAPIVGRQTTQEIALGKNILPAGVDVLFNIFSIHRNPSYWGEDADQFRPERFATKAYDRSAYLPFSAGMRNCVGWQYGMISMKIILIKLLTSYRLETDLTLEDFNMKFNITMKSARGYMVRLTRRQSS